MTRAETQKANMKKRWAGNRGRPGVEACQYPGPGGRPKEAIRYAVITASGRTEHDGFEEAREEYRIRRANLFDPVSGNGGRD